MDWGDCFCGKNGKKYQKDSIKTKIHFHLTIPKITSGAMVISVMAQRPAQMCMKCHFGTSNSHVFLSSNSITPDQDLN
jgi:hypothetical protein